MTAGNRSTLLLAIAVGGVLLGWLLSVAYAFTPYGRPAETPIIAWRDAERVAHGATVYAARCASCHGPIGTSFGAAAPAPAAFASPPLSPPAFGSALDSTRTPARRSAAFAPSLGGAGVAWQQPDFALFELIRTGASAVLCLTLDPAMPRFAELSDRDLLDALAYLKSNWTADQRRHQDEVNALYANPNALFRQRVKTGG